MNQRHPRRILPPGALRKRAERDATLPKPEVIAAMKPPRPTPQAKPAAEPKVDDKILAGCMAYEFLTRGTLLGRVLDNGQTQAVHVSPPGSSKETRTNWMKESRGLNNGRTNAAAHMSPPGPNKETHPSQMKKSQSYTELARVLKMEGAYIPGIVNPTDLARWVQNGPSPDQRVQKIEHRKRKCRC
ncbi:hypothetical protein SAY87_010895 [Trapa incisa]|uniref:Uncharacterized protein n=1 Tax=Trapa incisa TaxID=236973 RepID=A0AAN7GHS7_9MYRT|nr:hypothetical protein SAY87_010895 [Trapa incisa]